MDTDLRTRKQVSLEQLKALLDYMNEHRDLAKGLTRGRRGKLHSVKLWKVCAIKLNTIREGAEKDAKGWSKYWCDWKYRVRRRALELLVARNRNMAPPDGVSILTPMEKTMLEIIGDCAVSGVVIRTDPLAEGLSDTESYLAENNEEAATNNGDTITKRCKKRRHSSQEFSLGEDERPSISFEQKQELEKGVNHTDDDNDTAELILLEKEKLQSSKRLIETTEEISGHLGKLVDVLTVIKDILLTHRTV